MADHQSSPDLSTATLDELWGEIKTQFSGVVMVFDRPAKEGDYAVVEIYHHCQSNAHALGLSCHVYNQFKSGINYNWDPRYARRDDVDEDEQ